MADVKVNGNTYNGITHIQLAKADGGGYQKFIEGEGQWTTEGIASGAEPNGDIVMTGTVLNAFAFAGSSITSFEAAELTSIGEGVLRNCQKLETVKINATKQYGSNYMFANCTALKNVDYRFTEGGGYGSYCFTGCTALEEIILYANTSQSMFDNCTSLKKVDVHSGDLAGYICFSGCTALDTLILRPASVCTMHGVNVFSNTPFAQGGTGGTIYVPEALIDSYKAATNWSTLDGYGTITWAAIEGSEYDDTV